MTRTFETRHLSRVGHAEENVKSDAATDAGRAKLALRTMGFFC
jgi:hypothetical protein